mmetsp:Transcript_27917/g.38781  ORF Transcript_27917/g.38781 Transcript_27917/m.38781 type:complete len:757 (-) Transcript_27917:128-2398(-)
MDNWELGRVLGKGLCGVVQEAKHVEKDITAAMKVVNLISAFEVFKDNDVTMEKLQIMTETEIEVMRILDHPSIVKLYDSFQIEDNFYMFMELVEGKSLLQTIPPGGMAEDVAKNFFVNISSAITYMRCHNVIHGDLKPENILVDSQNNVKIIDFGFSHIVKNEDPIVPVGGTLLYAPPSDNLITFGWDDWSAGIILYAMVTYSLPFKRAELLSTSDLELNIPGFVSDDVVEVIVSLLTINRRARKTVGEVIYTCEWFKDSIGCLPETLSRFQKDLSQKREKETVIVETPEEKQQRKVEATVRRSESDMQLAAQPKELNLFARFWKKKREKRKSEKNLKAHLNLEQSSRKPPVAAIDIGDLRTSQGSVGVVPSPRTPKSFPSYVFDRISGSESPRNKIPSSPRSKSKATLRAASTSNPNLHRDTCFEKVDEPETSKTPRGSGTHGVAIPSPLSSGEGDDKKKGSQKRVVPSFANFGSVVDRLKDSKKPLSARESGERYDVRGAPFKKKATKAKTIVDSSEADSFSPQSPILPDETCISPMMPPVKKKEEESNPPLIEILASSSLSPICVVSFSSWASREVSYCKHLNELLQFREYLHQRKAQQLPNVTLLVPAIANDLLSLHEDIQKMSMSTKDPLKSIVEVMQMMTTGSTITIYKTFAKQTRVAYNMLNDVRSGPVRVLSSSNTSRLYHLLNDPFIRLTEYLSLWSSIGASNLSLPVPNGDGCDNGDALKVDVLGAISSISKLNLKCHKTLYRDQD